MNMIPRAKDKLLFTPGPLTTSLKVKTAMLHDAGSWHFEFNNLVAELRVQLLAVAGIQAGGGYECIPMQGSGTYGVEAVLGAAIPDGGKLLILSNGAYGERMIRMAKTLRIEHSILRSDEAETPDLSQLSEMLDKDPAITHIAMVHCETTTGILNPIVKTGQIAKARGCGFIVDAMSSFGAIPIPLDAASIDFMISSANKCLEGVPGFSFVIARKSRLLECEGRAKSLSLDLFEQWKGFEKNGQFRFTPPTHALLALKQAIDEWQDEGGVAGRGGRYADNHSVLIHGMRALGFEPYLKSGIQSFIITAFGYPDDEAFSFQNFYRLLSDNGMIIYPGKLTQHNTFRIGTIGRLFPSDIVQLVHAIENALSFMGCRIPVTQAQPVVV